MNDSRDADRYITPRERADAILAEAGLEYAGGWGAGFNVLPTYAALRPIAAGDTVPTSVVRLDVAEPFADTDAEWFRLATAHGLFGEDGGFLVTLGDGGWFRVRLGEQWRLADVLRNQPRNPEFMTISPDGKRLIGVTTEEYEIWLIMVEDVPAYREQRALGLAREESEEEREAAWDGLFGRPRISPRTRERWEVGLPYNAALPDDLKLDLVIRTQRFYGRQLPADLIDQLLVHPDWKMRSGVVDTGSNQLTPEQWSRLVLAEEGDRRRWVLVSVAVDYRATFTSAAYERLAADPVPRVRAETASLTGLPTALARALVTDPEPHVRQRACAAAWPDLDADERRALFTDADSGVRAAARRLHHREHPVPLAVFESGDLGDAARIVTDSVLEPELARHLSRHPDAALRRALADNLHLTPALIAVLAEDPKPSVRSTLALRPDISEAQRATISYDFDPSGHYHTLPWVHALHDDPEAMRRLSASPHPLIRRSAARARHLPPDVVDRLAHDKDRVVHLFLAESCDDAPPWMLLQVWHWWNGSLSSPGRPRTHPNFPRTDLLKYADDPNPRLRQLALDDPDSTPELVERFTHDPHHEVRFRAADDPRLSRLGAIRLLDDPNRSVRWAATQSPRLPARVLVTLLRERHTAEHAAQNTAIPPCIIRRMAEPDQDAPKEGTGVTPRPEPA
ncbi:PE-PGRS family protein [Streptomyces sp. NBC_01304]|uniref:PE-PGRS family protein n=1 Tax=Streptomyces sp. NBC_01304 TaxID=2903818 RepID=UPI002E10913E|nr:PE-PGRS family protein [Streptomyces sp. NBC_01304]